MMAAIRRITVTKKALDRAYGLGFLGWRGNRLACANWFRGIALVNSVCRLLLRWWLPPILRNYPGWIYFRIVCHECSFNLSSGILGWRCRSLLTRWRSVPTFHGTWVVLSRWLVTPLFRTVTLTFIAHASSPCCASLTWNSSRVAISLARIMIPAESFRARSNPPLSFITQASSR